MMIAESDYILNKLVTVIFSKDRPIQLDLTLKTNRRHSTPKIRNEIVLYKASNERIDNAYKQVAKENRHTTFIKETDFRSNLLDCMDNKEYILFLVDDCIFTRKYSIKDALFYLGLCEGALGFSLRLGSNTTYCYSLNILNELPEFQPMRNEERNGVYAFNWQSVKNGDFAYPLEVSSSIYRIDDIKPLLEKVYFFSPNSLEWMMYTNILNYRNRPFLLCFGISPAFCNPINRVQTENTNRAGVSPEYSIENLLKLYENGYRINYYLFDGFTSNACHDEQDIDFIKENYS